jgi:predicted Fe-S protein YdhL (DUF1289 family)
MVYLTLTGENCNDFCSASGPYFALMSSTVADKTHRPPRPQHRHALYQGVRRRRRPSLCLGCFRTLSEIGGWSGLTDDQRAAVMADLPARRARIDPARPGPSDAVAASAVKAAQTIPLHRIQTGVR